MLRDASVAPGKCNGPRFPFRRASEIDRKALGENHPAYATSLNNLAYLYQSQGDYARAESLYRQATETYKKALGENHPAYAKSLNSLALASSPPRRSAP
jgi:tetratricopeptide (TPR) repeat protein